MRKQDELTNPNSCMSRARDDEWTFVLLGRDVAAPHAVKAWIEQRIALGKNQRHDPQIVEAERWIANVLQDQETAVSPSRPVLDDPIGDFIAGAMDDGN